MDISSKKIKNILKQDFNNKVVWITGASSGIGEALSLSMAANGAQLVLTARNVEKLEALKEKCDALGGKAMVLPMDLSQIDKIGDAVSQVLNACQRIDVLINNAGMSQRALVREASLDIDRRIMELNYFSPVALTKAVLPAMLKQGGGQIVAVSSIVGKFGFPLRSAYSASKHALFGFFDSLRAEEESIDVSLVIPGRIHTNISLNAINKEGKVTGEMDPGQANGMTAEKCASIIIKGLKKKKKEILVGNEEILMVHIRRFLPRLYYRLAKKVSAK